jgi:hypothetical protein
LGRAFFSSPALHLPFFIYNFSSSIKKGAASCALSNLLLRGFGQLFFFADFAFFPADAFAFLSQPLTNLATAAPRLDDNLPSASARLLALVTSDCRLLTCCFKALILACSALTLAAAAERAAALLAAAAFLATDFAAVFLTAAFFAAPFFAAPFFAAPFFAAPFFTADRLTAGLPVAAFVAAGRPAFFLVATFLVATFLVAAFLTAGLDAFFFTAGRVAPFFAAELFVADLFAADFFAAGLLAVFAFGFDFAAFSAVAIIQSPLTFRCDKKTDALYISRRAFDTNALNSPASCIIVVKIESG